MPYSPADVQSGVQAWDLVIVSNFEATQARFTPRYVTASETLVATDSLVVMTGTTAAQTLSLLAAASWLGRPLWICNESTQSWDIDPNGTETIDGGGAGSAITLAAGSKTLLVAGTTGRIHRLV
jgi:hypothetical protein